MSVALPSYPAPSDSPSSEAIRTPVAAAVAPATSVVGQPSMDFRGRLSFLTQPAAQTTEDPVSEEEGSADAIAMPGSSSVQMLHAALMTSLLPGNQTMDGAPAGAADTVENAAGFATPAPTVPGVLAGFEAVAQSQAATHTTKSAPLDLGILASSPSSTSGLLPFTSHAPASRLAGSEAKLPSTDFVLPKQSVVAVERDEVLLASLMSRARHDVAPSFSYPQAAVPGSISGATLPAQPASLEATDFSDLVSSEDVGSKQPVVAFDVLNKPLSTGKESGLYPLGSGKPQASRQFMAALGERIHYQSTKGIESATMRLDPPSMGSVEIRVTQDAGGVHVSITASHPDVSRQLLVLSESLRSDLQARHQAPASVIVKHSNAQDGQSGSGQQGKSSDAEENVGLALSLDA